MPRRLKLALTLFVLCLGVASGAASQDQPYVPPALEQWVGWVRERSPELSCSRLRGEAACVWPGALKLDLSAQGGSFEYRASMDRPGDLALPGGNGAWPIGVTAGGTPAAVVSRENRPVTRLGAGEHVVRGSFSWSSMPRFLPVPPESGIVSLAVAGREVRAPRFGQAGELWLEEREEERSGEEERLDLAIYRRLVDGLPFRTETLLRFRVAGRARQIDLGNVTLAGQQPVRVVSSLPYRLDDGYGLSLQVRPGSHDVLVESASSSPPESLAAPAVESTEWPSQEIWSWAPAEDLRSVEPAGGSGIDPARTEMPEAWRSLSAFVMQPGETMTFMQLRRGQGEPPPSSLNLSRQLWLDLSGRAFTVQDRFTGTVQRDWRLNALPETALGHATVAGQEQLVTKDPQSGAAGVELRESNLDLVAESRLESGGRELSAVGWDHEVGNLSVALNLPPGWTLVEAAGADRVSSSWLGSWTLLDLFIVIMVSAGTQRLLGTVPALAVLLGLCLGKNEPGLPYQIWFHLLIALALLKVTTAGVLRSFAKVYFGCSLIALGVVLFAFAVSQATGALFPHLGSGVQRSLLIRAVQGLVETQPGLWICVTVFVAACWSIFNARWRVGLAGLAFSGALLFVSVAAGGVMSFSVEQRSYMADSGYAPAPAVSKASRQYASQALQQQKFVNLLQTDPNATIQTGPGLPSWRWSTLRIGWNGTVRPDQRLTLYLIGPDVNCFLGFVRAILLVVAGVAFARGGRRAFSALAVLFFALAVPAPARAQGSSTLRQENALFPPSELLTELERRLNRDRCLRDCTVTSQEEIRIEGAGLRLSAEVSSHGSGGWPLPGPLDQLAIEKVSVDGVETSALRRDDRGHLWVRIPAGAHRVEAEGRLVEASSVSLGWPEPPRRLVMHAPGWHVEGIRENGRVDSSVQLTRQAPQEPSDEPAGAPQGPRESLLPEWILVSRTLQIGIPWMIETRLERLGAADRPFVGRVALLPGESVTSDGVAVESGHAVFTMGRGAREISWSSTLSEQPAIELKASGVERVNELWKLVCSPIWSCRHAGLDPVSHVGEGVHEVTWRPWPGESLRISIERPQGAPGEAVTIDSAKLSWVPGARVMTGRLELEARASRGGYQKVILPEGVTVKRVSKGERESHVRPRGREISLPLDTGANAYVVEWQMPWSFAFFSRMPEVSVERRVFNANVTVDMPSSRWLLLTGGPKWGPAVLFWSKLILICAAAFFLARATGGRPLSALQIALLGIGLGNLGPDAMLIPFAWFYALQWRKSSPVDGRWRFNMTQVFLVVLSFVALLVFYAAIRQGLLVAPNMHISGGGSYGNHLVWYTDGGTGPLPVPWVVSAPLWAWRVIMLAWSGWIVFALLRWLSWGWTAFSSGGVWRGNKPAPEAAEA